MQSFDRFVKACADKKINPNQERYTAGYNDGLSVYCDPKNAYRLGLRGTKYRNSCPEESKYTFHAAFEFGNKLHVSQKQLSRNRFTIKKNMRNLDSLKTALEKMEKRILAAGEDSKEIMRLSSDLARLREKLQSYSQTTDTLLSESLRVQTGLENLQHKIPPVLSRS